MSRIGRKPLPMPKGVTLVQKAGGVSVKGPKGELSKHVPEGITGKVEKNRIALTGADRDLLGQTAAKVRELRPPEPYKGKGVKYAEEVIKKKAGKAGATGGGGGG